MTDADNGEFHRKAFWDYLDRLVSGSQAEKQIVLDFLNGTDMRACLMSRS